EHLEGCGVLESLDHFAKRLVLDIRETGHAQLVFFDRFCKGTFNRARQNLVTNLSAVLLLHQPAWHLARSEAGKLGRTCQAIETLIDFLDNRLHRHYDSNAAAEIANGFNSCCHVPDPLNHNIWCERRDSNSHALRRWNL